MPTKIPYVKRQVKDETFAAFAEKTSMLCVAYLGHVSDGHDHITVGQEVHAATPVVVGARAPVVDEDLLGPTSNRRGGLVKVDLNPDKPVVLLAEKGLNKAVIFEPKAAGGIATERKEQRFGSKLTFTSISLPHRIRDNKQGGTDTRAEVPGYGRVWEQSAAWHLQLTEGHGTLPS